MALWHGPGHGRLDAFGTQEAEAEGQKCCCATQVDSVLKGNFKGGKTLLDYYAFLSPKDPKRVATVIKGLFTNRPGVAGVSVSGAGYLVGNVQIVSDTKGPASKCSISQSVNYETYVLKGQKNALQGQTVDDLKKFEEDYKKQKIVLDTQKPPFIQYIPGGPSWADPTYINMGLANTELVRNYVSCVNSGGPGSAETCKNKTCCGRR